MSITKSSFPSRLMEMGLVCILSLSNFKKIGFTFRCNLEQCAGIMHSEAILFFFFSHMSRLAGSSDTQQNISGIITNNCSFSSSFSWTRNGTHFDVDDDPNVTMKPHSGTLVIDISGVKAEEYERVYQCTARNKHGTAISDNIVVRQSRKNRAVRWCQRDSFIIIFFFHQTSHISHIIIIFLCFFNH